MKKFSKFFLAIVLLLLMVWPIYYFLNKQNSDKVGYNLEKPLVRDIQDYIICSGVISPKEEVEIKSRVAGVLKTINVRIGDSVEKGQVIGAIKIIPDIGQLANAESNIEMARIARDNQKRSYDRNQILIDKGVISQVEFEAVEKSYREAEAKLKQSKREYEIIKTGDVSNKQSNNLIISTIEGIVTLLPTKEGETIIESNNFNEGTTIAKIANMKEMIFEGKVKEYEVAGLEIGMPVIINSGLNKNKQKGEIIEISTSGENIEGTILFNIKVKLKDLKIKKTGYSANAKILVQEHENVLCIKEEWLKFEEDSAYVTVKEGEDKLAKRFVELGLSDGIYTEVLAGLKKNEILKVNDK